MTLIEDVPIHASPEGYQSLSEAALTLGLSQKSLRQRIERGTLSGTKVMGAWYLTTDQVEALRGAIKIRNAWTVPELEAQSRRFGAGDEIEG